MDKNELLSQLQGGDYVSGQALAERFGVSRAAVAKAIAALRRAGYQIDAAPNRGYRLESRPDLLTQAGVRAALGEHPWAGHTEVFDRIDSTNNYLKRRAAEGAVHGSVAIADCQTGGRGRMGRRFDSAPGAGIYLSILLRPACPPQALMTLTAQAAVAVRAAIGEVCGVWPEIKWVNDLLLGSRKICGILTELSLEAETGLVSYAVVGVGVNCNREQFPEELKTIAGSILSQTGKPVDRSCLAAEMIRALFELPGLDWHGEYTAACMNLGRPVSILAPGKEPVDALALEIGPRAELIVRTSGGERISVNSGEVSIRAAASPDSHDRRNLQ